MLLAEKDVASKAATLSFGAPFFLSSHITTIHHACESPTFGRLLIEFCSPGFLFGLLSLTGAFFYLICHCNQFKW
jgi:hypothetical protein